MISRLIEEVQSFGSDISLDGDKLKLHGVGMLPDSYKSKLKKHREELLELFKQQEAAKEDDWMIYPFGEAYEKQVGRNTRVFIFKETNDKFTVWRGTWKEKPAPDSDKLVISNVDFEKALEKANNYVLWFKRYVKNSQLRQL